MARRQRSPTRSRGGAAAILATLVLLVGGLWLLELIDQLFYDETLDLHGIAPRKLLGLWGVLFAPFLHAGYAHLIANTVPLLVLGWLVLLRGVVVFLEVTILVALLGGLGTWVIGDSGAIHLGASILIFGYFGYLLFLGVLERSAGAIVVAVLVGVLYGGLIWGVLPQQTGVSWEGHLCGFLAGALSARIGRKKIGSTRRR